MCLFTNKLRFERTVLGVLFTVKMCSYSTVHTECEDKEGLKTLHVQYVERVCVRIVHCAGTLSERMQVPILYRE
jgi:hypothetical protein